jgi:hypothetical protein
MSIQPSDEVLQRFGVRLIAPLGGRLNQHWLVEFRREPLVLRRWSQPADEIDYELRLLARIAALGWPGGATVPCHMHRYWHVLCSDSARR